MTPFPSKHLASRDSAPKVILRAELWIYFILFFPQQLFPSFEWLLLQAKKKFCTSSAWARCCLCFLCFCGCTNMTSLSREINVCLIKQQQEVLCTLKERKIHQCVYFEQFLVNTLSLFVLYVLKNGLSQI